MFWIYIPPIILVAALTALFIILSRKSSALRKEKLFRPSDNAGPAQPNKWKIRAKSAGSSALHLTEKFLFLMKNIFRKTDALVSAWAASVKRRRKGGDTSEVYASRPHFEIPDAQEKIIKEIEEADRLTKNLNENDDADQFQMSGLLVRKKIREEPIVIPKKELLPEDKVRESALIYRIAENPKDIEAYREIGDYYLGIGNIKDSKEAFKMVLKLRPRDLKAKSSLREIEMRMRLGS